MRDEYNLTSKKKVRRIGKVNYEVENDDFEIILSKNMVIDYVDKKWMAIEEVFVVDYDDDDDIEYLEERFFRESCMMTYDYSGRVEPNKYAFVLVKKGTRHDET